MDPDYGAALLKMLFTQSPVGLHVMDRDLLVVRSNTASCGVEGIDPANVVGRTLRESGLATEEVEERLRRVLETGEPLVEHTYLMRMAVPYPQDRMLSMSAFRLEEDGTRPVGVAVTTIDITERWRAQRRLELLHRASEDIGTTLDIFRTAQELADVVVTGLADMVSVEVLDSVLRGDAPAPGPLYDRLTVRRAGHRAAAGVRARNVYGLGAVRMLHYGTPYSQALSDLRPRLVRRLTPDDAWLTRNEVLAKLIREAGLHSLIAVPLTARGVVLGIASFYRAGDSPAFDEPDLGLAADVASRAATCIDNARHYTREHTRARLVQRNLLPVSLPEHAAVETAYTYLPFASGGAWYDVISLSGSRVALVAGDVSGRGMPAVVTMGRLRTVVGALAVMDLSTEELLERLHDMTAQLAREYPSRIDSPVHLTATCLYAIYDPVMRACDLASAGHPPPVLVWPDGRAEIPEVPQGPVLGRGVADYTTTRFELPPGTVLCLRNAGLAMTDTREELHIYEQALSRPGSRLWDICDDLAAWLLPEDPVDDAMLLLARTRALAPHQVASWTLPSRPESVAEARRLVQQRLAEWGLADLGFTTELIASELVTNALRYSSGPVDLRLIRDGSLICEVTDRSGAAPHLRHAEDDDEGGRGLYLVAQTTTRWGMRRTDGGKTIWTEQPLP
ncbi:SpoIIE family protein phosphatase [Streptomyces sp. TS71-3]|uniref:SpoIIE family protein phosphatase n=1 Tax=Streptomyces sp. TS71-3 TaxID=2733862 RepID=UPI001B023F34|nr:SpoIIE family protein phosphatase [Streptomyces sp. TS71-3]GHJ42174.1 hypothetical protein Sm713_77830 [Streptomyces sp. TS71-3]